MNFLLCQKLISYVRNQNSGSSGKKDKVEMGENIAGSEGHFWGNNFVFLNLGSSYVTSLCENSSSCVLTTGILNHIQITLTKMFVF